MLELGPAWALPGQNVGVDGWLEAFAAGAADQRAVCHGSTGVTGAAALQRRSHFTSLAVGFHTAREDTDRETAGHKTGHYHQDSPTHRNKQ